MSLDMLEFVSRSLLDYERFIFVVELEQDVNPRTKINVECMTIYVINDSALSGKIAIECIEHPHML